MIMRAERDNAVRYLGSWVAAVAAGWSLLMIYGRENDWVDRFIFFEIALCGLFACYFIIRYSPKLTVRVIGVFSLFAGIVVLYTAAQLLDLGVWGTPPRFTEPPPKVLSCRVLSCRVKSRRVLSGHAYSTTENRPATPPFSTRIEPNPMNLPASSKCF